MSHSLNKIWLHVIFSTKDRQPLIKGASENLVHTRLKEQLIESGCFVKTINGMPDHVHLLFLQTPKSSITEIIKQVKGNSAHWINEQNITADKFSWQPGYAAYSVSESQLEKVHQYITNQKSHHAKKTFSQEYEEFMSAHGLTENTNG